MTSKKNSKTDKSNNNQSNEENSNNGGKIEKVPFTAVKAYLDKYKGIGRLDEKVNKKEGGSVKKAKGGETHIQTKEEAERKHWKGRPLQINMNGKRKHEAEGKGENMVGEFEGEDPIAEKQGGEVFMPNMEDGETMEGLDMNENNNFDYAARYQNLLSRQMVPNHSEFDAISNGGVMKSNVNNIEIEAVVRAMNTLSNDRALSLFESRYQQLEAAQRMAAQVVTDDQPGYFQFDESLVFMLEHYTDMDNIDLQIFDPYLQKATEQVKYFQTFFDSVCIGLEKNFSFDLQFADYFTSKFSQYLVSFVNESNSDFVSKVVSSAQSNVTPVSIFIQSCNFAVTTKTDLIKRQVQLAASTGSPTIFTDLQLSTILDATFHLRSTLESYAAVLSGQNNRINKTNAAIPTLKGSGISANLTGVRNKIARHHQGKVLNEKVGGAQGQTMSEAPSSDEIRMLSAHAELKNISADDEVVRTQKVVLLAEIERYKNICQEASFVNIQPLNDLEAIIRFLLNQSNVIYETVDGSSNHEPIDLSLPFTGEEVWIAEAQLIQTGVLNFSLEEKIIMCQGYIESLKMCEQRAKSLIENIMRRIGIDPLAPLIVTHEMSDVFKQLGYYCEANTGLQQALEDLKVKMSKTNEMDDDLAKVIIESKSGDNPEYLSRLLDSILTNFGGVSKSNGLSADQQFTLAKYVCGSCNKLYSVDDKSVPITLPCGDVQCLICTIGLKKCFKCNAGVDKIPDNPALYNPTIHCPLDFSAMLKMNADLSKQFMINSLLNNNVNQSFSKDQAETVAQLLAIMSDITQFGQSIAENTRKNYNFFVDIMNCSRIDQFQKIVIQMLDQTTIDDLKKLVGMALQIADLFGGKNETRFILANTIQAIVSSARIPAQGLAVEILLDKDLAALQAYCSVSNVKAMQDIFTTRQEFVRNSHFFQYADIAPLALDVVSETIKTLEGEEFDDVINKPLRIFLLKQFQESYIFVKEAVEANNYSLLNTEMNKVFKLFFNELAVYLKPVSSMTTTAVEKCNKLWSYYTDTIFNSVLKKYPMSEHIECDPTLIDLKYCEVMMESSREKLSGMYNYAVENKEAIFNAAVAANSQVEGARCQLLYPGVKFDLPTDSSVYKNLPPYICAVNQDTLGNNPALPLYQFSMSNGSMLDNPYLVNIPKELELAHTEGHLFYTGYDGFLEEYTPQTFDPTVRDTAGTIQPRETIIHKDEVLAARASTEGATRQPNLPITPSLNLMDQLKFEAEKAKKLKEYNENYYSNMFGSILNDPLVKSGVTAMFGLEGYAALAATSQIARIGEKVYHYAKNSNTWFKDNFVEGDPSSLPMHFSSKLTGLMNNLNDFFGVTKAPTLPGLPGPSGTYGAGMKKHSKIHDLVHQKYAKGQKEYHSKKIIHPILKACGILRMRKNIHDVHDHTVNTHNLKKDQKSIEEKSPSCGHCGGRANLRIHNQSGECCCGDCFKGKGITSSRKIMNEKNSEDLHTSSNASHKSKAEAYRNYIFKNNSPVQPLVGGAEHSPANDHWENIKTTARPYFRGDPDNLIHSFMKHRISEPLGGSYTHNLKNAALIGGKLHSMLNVEKKNMSPEHYDNLKHNYAWHLAHLPHGAGKIASRNLVGRGDAFPTIAQNLHNAKSETKQLVSNYI